MQYTKQTLAAILVLTLGTMSATTWAQPPRRGPGGPPPRGGEGRMRRDNAKRQLNMLVRSMGRLERSSTPLSKGQAQRIVSLLKPWQSRPRMTQPQAKTLRDGLNAVLTTQQKSALNTMREDRRERRGDDGPRDGMRGPRGEDGPLPRRDGFMPPPPAGEGGFDPQKMRAQMQRMRGFMETMNPFYPPTRYSEVKALPPRMQEAMIRRYSSMQKTLNALSRRAAR